MVLKCRVEINIADLITSLGEGTFNILNYIYLPLLFNMYP